MDLTRPLSLVQQVGEDACRALADRGDAVLQPEVGVGARVGRGEFFPEPVVRSSLGAAHVLGPGRQAHGAERLSVPFDRSVQGVAFRSGARRCRMGIPDETCDQLAVKFGVLFPHLG
jgi:hypothetical protein